MIFLIESYCHFTIHLHFFWIMLLLIHFWVIYLMYFLLCTNAANSICNMNMNILGTSRNTSSKILDKLQKTLKSMKFHDFAFILFCQICNAIPRSQEFMEIYEVNFALKFATKAYYDIIFIFFLPEFSSLFVFFKYIFHIIKMKKFHGFQNRESLWKEVQIWWTIMAQRTIQIIFIVSHKISMK